jgi:hypothetical protein
LRARLQSGLPESGNFSRREISMKKLIALSLLAVSACAGPSAVLGRRTSSDSIVG